MTVVERLEDTGDEQDFTLPPHSTQAEQAVLGSVLKRPSCLYEVVDHLSANDFYHKRNRHIFQAMLALHVDGVPADYHSIADRLTQLDLYEQSGGLAYLSELNLATPSAAHIVHYAGIVKRTSTMRRLISAGATIAEIGYRDNNPSIDAALERAQKALENVDNRLGTGEFTPLEEALGNYLERSNIASEVQGENKHGVPTGFMDIDRQIGGFKPGELIILAARPSTGKTAMCLAFAVNAALRAAVSTLVFSLEMSIDQLCERLISMQSGVDSTRIRNGNLTEQESGKINMAINSLAKCNIWIDDTSTLSISQVRARARRFAQARTVDMIAIDYLQLIDTPGANRAYEVGEVAKSLKQFAREMSVPIIALSQLSRKVDDRLDHTPMLSDLSESGGLEQHTDVVLALFREEKYNPDTDRKGLVDVITLKNRNGPTGRAQLVFLERSTAFLDLEVYRT